MKHLLKTLCTPSNVKLLTGLDLTTSFPLRFPKSEDKKKAKLRQTQTLQQIIEASPEVKKRSFDSRFDDKHPIEIAIENLQQNGFTKEQVYKLLHHKQSVLRNRIEGTLKYLANFITDEYEQEIIGKLKEVSYDKGKFIRNGQVF